MDIIIRGSKLEITDSMEAYAKEKICKLEKYFNSGEKIKATVLAKIHGHLNTVEVTIPLKSLILRAEESNQDFYAAVDVVIDKLERQIRRNKTKLSSKKKDVKEFVYDVIEEDDDVEDFKIVKRKKIDVKPMSEEEAILQMELLGHEFYLFNDSESNKPSLIYRRKDGNYGKIEAE